jgi:hypothetical protein
MRFAPLIFMLSFLFSCQKNNVQPSPTITTAFNDNFTNNNHDWYESNTDSSYVQIQNDTFFISNKIAGESWNVWKLIQIDTTKNFAIKATITWKSGVTNYGYGLMWGLSNVNTHYGFEICVNGAYLIYSEQNGIRTYLVNWTASNYIQAKSNVLEVQKENGKYQFYINGNEVFSTAYQPFFGFGTGFIVNDVQGVAINNLNITQW